MFTKKRISFLASSLLLFFCVSSSVYAESTRLISVSSEGVQGNGGSSGPVISNTGRYVAFVSSARNLVPGVDVGGGKLFLHDLETSETTLVAISASNHSISGDGQFVAYMAYASAMVDGAPKPVLEVFVYDRETGQSKMASVNQAGDPADKDCWYPTLSADGRYVAYSSLATNLLPYPQQSSGAFIYDQSTGTTETVGQTPEGEVFVGHRPALSSDGRFVAFFAGPYYYEPNDINGASDIYVRDRQTGAIELVSKNRLGFSGNDASYWPSISPDGRYVTFMSYATDLDVDVAIDDTYYYQRSFVHDRLSGETKLAGVSSSGAVGAGSVTSPAISADGRFVSFSSFATDLVSNDSNGFQDVFTHDFMTGETVLTSVGSLGQQGDADSGFSYQNRGTISGDGRFIVFASNAANLVENDLNGQRDVFVRDRASDSDSDGFLAFKDVIVDDCDDNDPAINPLATEISYNGIDENCNGMGDDDDLDGDGFVLAYDCNDLDPDINPEAVEIKFDDIDQDCNGYDLTIVATKAVYNSKNNFLTVEAQSDYGQAAMLNLYEYGTMRWKKSEQKWLFSKKVRAWDSQSVVIVGEEGYVLTDVLVE